MKILHIIPSLQIGGAEILTVNLAVAQKKLGHDVCICCLMYPPETGTLISSASANNIPVYFSYCRHEPRLLPIIKLMLLIRRICPDVVQSHLPRSNPAATIAARLAGVRCIVATYHNPIIWSNKRQRRWGRFAARWQDGIFCDAEIIKKKLIEYNPSVADKARVLYPGVITKRTPRFPENYHEIKKKLCMTGSEKLAGIVARLAPVKGHAVLIDAAEQVIRHNPNVRFLIVGDGPTKNDLYKVIIQKNLEKHVLLTGYVHDIDSIFSILDLYVLPSFSEGFPLCILEALVFGIPIVATNVGGIPEVIKSGVNGILVEPNNPGKLSDAILKTLADPVAMACMKMNAIESAKSFSIENTAQNAIKLYEEIRR